MWSSFFLILFFPPIFVAGGTGLVNAYLEAGKFREAGFYAKEANEIMPGDARTVLLTGNVWEHIKGGMTDNREKVRRCWENGYFQKELAAVLRNADTPVPQHILKRSCSNYRTVLRFAGR